MSKLDKIKRIDIIITTELFSTETRKGVIICKKRTS